MKLNCISCGHNMDLDSCYDDFEGQVKCYVCGALLTMKASDGKLKSVTLAWPLRNPGEGPKDREVVII
jgi:ribosomal protein S27E